MTDYPSITDARLPAAYEHAKQALAECSRIDECQDWADKAAAMASYAKQSEDETLFKLATRIRSRAIRRCGELLKQLDPAKGGRPSKDTHTANGTSLSRTDAATEAGLSKRQKDTALRVASVEEKDFEAQVESDDPPTVTRLAQQGTASKPKPLYDPEGINPAILGLAMEARDRLRDLAKFAGKNDPGMIVKGFKSHEISKLREWVHSIDKWLDVFIGHLGDAP